MPRRVVHAIEDSDGHGKLMDSRNMIRCKEYYQVLLVLPKALDLSPRVPSDELVLFFRLLLQGKKVVPGLKAKELLALTAESEGIHLDTLLANGEIHPEALEDFAAV